MTLRQLEAKLDGDKMLRFVARHAGSAIAGEALQVARRWSSGTWSMAALAMAGHPYRQGGPNPLDPGMINSQRGVFRGSWRTVRSLGGRGGGGAHVALLIENDSDVADFMYGTAFMITRPVWFKIENDLREPFQRAIIAGVEAYWK